MEGFVGSTTSVQTARFSIRSSVGFQLAPASVDLKTPPATPAANITSGFVGSITTARVRPPTLPGPIDCQPWIPPGPEAPRRSRP
jgi:hypothetical protein